MSAELPVVFLGAGIVERIARCVEAHQVAFLAAGRADDGKFEGVSPTALDELVRAGLADAVLVEADGARQRPFKAPAAHEPVVPACASIVSFMMGIDALGRPVEGASVHRPEVVLAYGQTTVTAGLMAAVTASPSGGLKGVPPGAVARPIINKALGPLTREAATVAAAVLAQGHPSIDRVLVTDLQSGTFGVLRRRG